ncbi:pentatricopeptide repeat-containing protein At5g47360 [Cornus florida]|uniref:pentatricopeptide repeat-containing protein At5g47360 n=1 Tax=Cornus florida TaxID=4283 RepID=UPI00289C98C7|nr:pentatricopeptide repeat-containing protein At5g47360 [Cornus florida]
MASSSIPRFLSSGVRLKNPTFSLPFTTLSSAEKYWTHLQKNVSNPEKALNTVGAPLDISCVNEVLQRCAPNQPLLGLRFFVWAGLQANYRHSSYMYAKVCKLFRINRNRQVFDDVIEAYRVEGCLVSVKTFKVLLNLCKEAKLADEGLWVLRKMKEFNCRPDTTAYNVVIRLFCEKGKMDVAAVLMREMGLIDLYPDMITYVAMIKGFCDVGRLEDACGLFKVMRRHGCSPNVVAYATLVDGLCRFSKVEKALELLEEMEKEGGECKPNTVTYTAVIQRLCEDGRSMEALQVLDQMVVCGCAPNRVTLSTLIKGLCTEGCLEETYKLIDKVVAGGSVSNGECYSSLMLSLLQNQKLDEAEKLSRRMLASDVKPDGLASSTLIRRLCLEGRVLDGFRFYDEIEKLGYLTSIDSDIYSILLAGLCRESHLVEAATLARLMIKKGIQPKTPYVDDIIEYLKNSGNMELMAHIARMGRS